MGRDLDLFNTVLDLSLSMSLIRESRGSVRDKILDYLCQEMQSFNGLHNYRNYRSIDYSIIFNTLNYHESVLYYDLN